MNIDERITKFIRKHHVLTLATVGGDNLPYVANCFYAYDTKRGKIIFTSDLTTRHGKEMELQPRVALSIVRETRIVGCVEGIQIEGIAERGSEEARKVAATTLDDVRRALRINYFEDTELIARQAEEYRQSRDKGKGKTEK